MGGRWTAEQQRKRRQSLIAARKCEKCAAGLLDTEVGTRCTGCAAANVKEARRRRGTPQGRRVGAAWTKRKRDARRAAETCLDCPLPPEPGKARCTHHLEMDRVYAARYLDRKEAAC